MKVFFDNENPRGSVKKIFASIMVVLYENLFFFFNGMARNHNFRREKRKIAMKNLFFSWESFFLNGFPVRGIKKEKNYFRTLYWSLTVGTRYAGPAAGTSSREGEAASRAAIARRGESSKNTQQAVVCQACLAWSRLACLAWRARLARPGLRA